MTLFTTKNLSQDAMVIGLVSGMVAGVYATYTSSNTDLPKFIEQYGNFDNNPNTREYRICIMPQNDMDHHELIFRDNQLINSHPVIDCLAAVQGYTTIPSEYATPATIRYDLHGIPTPIRKEIETLYPLKKKIDLP